MKTPQEALREDFAKQRQSQAALEQALARYSQLHRYRDRWNNVYYATEEVNERVTDCIITHNCGCCADSPLEVYPYLEEDGLRIFSDPTCFTVGEKAGIGEQAYYGWERKLREARIPEAIIDKIQKMFDEEPPCFPDLEDDW